MSVCEAKCTRISLPVLAFQRQVVLSALEARTHFRDGDHVLAWAFRAARHRAVALDRRLHGLVRSARLGVDREGHEVTPGDWCGLKCPFVKT